MTNIPQTQYELVKQSRKVVMDYCKTFTQEQYVQRVEYFGRGGSIRNLQVHVANTYLYWLANFGLQQSIPYINLELIESPSQMEACFKIVDEHVEKFRLYFENKWDSIVSGKLPQRDKYIETSALSLFTHVITHEFHHKGQIMTMGRILGNIPPDADLIRF
jgi:uncharacterized damage-inducible protein DinB